MYQLKEGNGGGRGEELEWGAYSDIAWFVGGVLTVEWELKMSCVVHENCDTTAISPDRSQR